MRIASIITAVVMMVMSALFIRLLTTAAACTCCCLLDLLASSCDAAAAADAAAAEPQLAATAFTEQLLPWLQQGIEQAGLAGSCPRLAESFELRSGRHGLTLFAKRRFERGDVLAVLPLTRLVTEDEYRTPTTGSMHSGRGDWRHDLALYLARERLAGASSRWAPYFAVLPETFDQRPEHWPSELLQEHLRGSHFQAEVEQQRSTLAASFGQLVADGYTSVPLRDYLWGVDVLTTRSMRSDREGYALPLMFPLFDLALHGDWRNIRNALATVDAAGVPGHRQTVLQTTAVRRILPGDEILNNYIEYGKRMVLFSRGRMCWSPC